MSRRIHKATFERKVPPSDVMGTEKESWEKICSEFVSLEPLSGRELFQAQQVQAQTTHKAKATYGTTLATVKPDDRMKIAKPVPENQLEPNAEENYRLFHIESIVNVMERNRELELMVVERT